MRSIVLALTVSLVLLTGCTKTPESPPPESVTTTTTEEKSAIALLSGKHTAMIKTAFGDMTVELDADAAPKTVTNFIIHARAGYYDNLTFHRVIEDFMIQGGDPEGTGGGGESVYGATFEDEINAGSYGLDTTTIADVAPPEQLKELPKEMHSWTIQEYYEAQGYVYNDALTSLPMKHGTLAMANRGANTNGSQFFIVHAEATPWLEGKHTVFGNIVKGMDVLDKIAGVETGANDAPVKPVTFTVEVVE